MNRAVLDDIVAIEIFPESRWSCPSSLALVDEGEKGDDSVAKEVRELLNDAPHLWPCSIYESDGPEPENPVS